MKKFKFFRKSRFWLTSFALATTGSLVLAACSSTEEGKKEETPKNPSNPNNPSNPDTPTTPTVPKASAEQLATATALLAENSGLQASLVAEIETKVQQIEATLVSVTAVGALNQTTTAGSVTALGTSTAAAATSGKVLYPLVKQLETYVTTAAADLLPAAQKTEATTLLNNVKAVTETLRTALNALPAAPAANAKTALQTANEALLAKVKAVQGAATAAAVKAAIAEVLTAQTAVQTALDAQVKLLTAAQTAAFALDNAASVLLNTLITQPFAKFLADTEQQAGKVLTLLVDVVRTDVLGELGQDLWATADQGPTGLKQLSTLLYKVVVDTAKGNSAWTSVQNEVKELTYRKAIAVKEDVALNIFALNVNTNLFQDVSRLNAYLLSTSNAANVEAQVNSLVKPIMDDLTASATKYASVLVTPTTPTGAMAKLVQDLTTLENAETDSTRKTAVGTFKTTATALVEKFAAFNTKLQELLKLFPNVSAQARDLNNSIGVARTYGDVLNVVGNGQLLTNTITAVTSAVAAPAEGAMTGLIAEITALATDVAAEGSFGKALTAFVALTGWTGNMPNTEPAVTIETFAWSIAKADKTGYVYKDFVDGTVAVAASRETAAVPLQLSFAQFKMELEKLQNGDTTTDPVAAKGFKTILGLLSKQFQPSQESQTFALKTQLAQLYNNNRVTVAA